MSDETPNSRTRRTQPASPDETQAASAPASPDDPDAALRRLESMGGAPAASPREPAGLPPMPVVDSFAAPPARPPRPAGATRREPKPRRPRPAGSGSTRSIARLVAPVVFLVAVIAFVGIIAGSHVLGGAPTPTPTPTATRTLTKVYVVKSGDSLSSIAARFNTTTEELQQLNPSLGSSSTLVVGKHVKVPRQ